MAEAAIQIDIGATTGSFDAALVRVKAGIAGLDAKMKNMSKSLNDFGDKSVKMGKKLSGATAAMGAAAAGAFALSQSAAASGNAIDKSSKAVGLSTNAYQELQFALGQVSDMATTQVDGAFRQLTTRLGQAKEGSTAMVDAFAAIGVSQDELQSESFGSEEAFAALTAAAQNAEGPAEAMAMAAKLMGEEAGKLGPILLESGSEMDALKQQAHDLGIVMSQENVDAAASYTDKMRELSEQLKKSKDDLGVTLMPVMLQFSEVLQTKIIPAVNNVIAKIGELTEWWGTLAPPVQEAAAAIALALGAAGPILIAVGLMSKAFALLLGTGPIGLFIAAAALAVVAWQKWGKDIMVAVLLVRDWFINKFTEITDFFANLPAQFTQFGKDIINGIIDGVDAVWEDLKFVFTSLGEDIKGWFKGVLGINSPSKVFTDFGKNIMQGLINGISEMWEATKAKVMELGSSVGGWFKSIMGIESPSKVFRKFGNFIGMGLAQGIEESASLVKSSVDTLGDSTKKTAFETAKSVVGSMGQLFQGSKPIAIAQALINTWQGATEALKMPFPSNIAAFAASVATGMKAVQSIKSTSKAGGGSGSAAASVPAQAAAPTTSNMKTMSIGLTGDGVMSGVASGLKEQLGPMLNEAFENGWKPVFV